MKQVQKQYDLNGCNGKFLGYTVFSNAYIAFSVTKTQVNLYFDFKKNAIVFKTLLCSVVIVLRGK